MKKLGVTGQKWLKAFHILVASVWVGCAIVLTVKQFLLTADDGRQLYGILATLDFIDLYILVPGAIGTLLTAIIYSTMTNWGWFKHNWITVKWTICLYGIIFGTYPLGPWLSEMAQIAGDLGLQALTDATFIHNRELSLIFGTFQAATIVFAVFISVLKPWKKKKAPEN